MFGGGCFDDDGRVQGFGWVCMEKICKFNDGKQIWETTANVLLELCCFFPGQNINNVHAQ